MDWLIANKEWVFSGIGIFVLTLVPILFKKPKKKESFLMDKIIINNTNTQQIPSFQSGSGIGIGGAPKQQKALDDFKNETRILFIDDDARFKVVKILTSSGWVHTKLIKDAPTLDDSTIRDAHILFIDVQGVGVLLGFSDEGLGLALAIKQKYPNKKVVIYSAETRGDRFHEALRKADSFLSKNADPYEFQKIVEDFTIGSKE